MSFNFALPPQFLDLLRFDEKGVRYPHKRSKTGKRWSK